MSKGPRIVLWDIETTHNLAAIFRLYDDFTSHENIVQERYIVSAAWKVLGEATVHSISTLDDAARFARNPHDDLSVCKALHSTLSAADVIVAHNGDAYDIKFAEGRFLIHGLSPLPPITKIDTLKAAKDRFLFNCNKLDYLGKVLGCGRKVKTDNSLWMRVLQGEKAAIREMVAYNKKDVVLLEKVFLKLQPYMKDHVNRHLYGGSGCPRCGSHHVQSRGVHRAISQVYQRYQCQACGGWFRELKADRTKSAKTRIL